MHCIHMSRGDTNADLFSLVSLGLGMDPESQRAIEEEVVSHISTGSDVGNRGDPAVQVPKWPAQPQ